MGGPVQDLNLLIVTAAVLSFIAILCKQPVIIAYIIGGILVGPWGMGWINELEFITAVSLMGVTLLLFLAGLCLHPEHLRRLFRSTSIVTTASCLSFFIIAFLFAAAWQFVLRDSIYIGLAMMFSSTIVAVKLLPTTKLHHGKIGAICIGILIAQDLIAVAILVLIRGLKTDHIAILDMAGLFVKLLILTALTFVFEQFALRKVLRIVDRFHETIFIIGLAWCFGIAMIFDRAGLSYEIGAFFAGVALARHPISLFISESLKPLRDFFLVLFFFALGARIDLSLMNVVILPAIILALVFVILKPVLLNWFFRLAGQEPSLAREAGLRLGQASEFSLLIAILALESGQITNKASQLIQMATIFTILLSSYAVIFSYPTPIGTREKLIQD